MFFLIDIFVFSVFLLSTLLTWNILPPWFEYLEDIKELYKKKYFERDSNSLPHLHLNEMAGLNTLKEKLRYEQGEKEKKY